MSVAVTVAPTGPIATVADNPHLPTQPEEIAAEVARCYDAGATVAHLHFRDREGRPTADLDVARRTIDLIAGRCPIIIQISTGVGLEVQFDERAALVELQPEMATLNPCSMSFAGREFRNPPQQVRRLARRMQELGVKPELEIYDTGHLDECLRLRDEGFVDGEHLQFSIVLGVAGGMAATPDNLLSLVRRLPAESIWQVIAIGRYNLSLSAMGVVLGGNVRAGLEDTLHFRRGELAKGSEPLVKRAAQLVQDLDLPVAGLADARRALSLS